MRGHLYGRDVELAALAELVDGIRRRGGALVVRGEAGIGKSSLLDWARRRAADSGVRTLATAGVQAETRLPFAGLHQLLRPVLGEIGVLPAPQRSSLDVAFGVTDGAPPDVMLVGLATLSLLGEVAGAAPVLVLVEDADWLDRPSSEVLAFVARRIEHDPIVILVAHRGEDDSRFEPAGLPELVVTSLAEESSVQLLGAHLPALTPERRDRVLAAAAGNPLALIELPAALEGDHVAPAGFLPLVPVTARVEEAFAARAATLPERTRRMLLLAAANDGDSPAELLAASAAMDPAASLADIDPAAQSRLVALDSGAVRFRHPLVRSALYQRATTTERDAAHQALAAALADQPDRQAWHLAAATRGVDDDVAAALEAAAERASRRGGLTVAVAALERSAQLSTDNRLRARRLLRAAKVAVELGWRERATGLAEAAEVLTLGPLERGHLLWIREMVARRVLDRATLSALLATARLASEEGDLDLTLDILWLVAQRTFWVDPGPSVRASIVEHAESVLPAGDDPRRVAILAYTAPVERAGTVIDVLSRVSSAPGADHYLGTAGVVTAAFDLAGHHLANAAASLRTQGRLGHLARVLTLRALAAFYTGEWTTAVLAADEAERLAAETGDLIWLAGARVAKAIVAAGRGDAEAVDRLAAETEAAMLPFGANFMLAGAQLARGLGALGEHRPGDAYDHLRRIFDPDDPAYHHFIGWWGFCDLAEAAVHSGHADEARGWLAELEAINEQTPSAWLHAAARYARALLADDAHAAGAFAEAVPAAAACCPFIRARVQLSFGVWLRRHRQVVESRTMLRHARDTFDAVGAPPWAEKARQELRAAGEASEHRPSERKWDDLTPQELQIARLAAEGLSNRQIGEQLFLSHRTVGSHLYRIFPKLGVTSRHQLSQALPPSSSSLA